jgi:hypothetical protein
MTVEDTIHIEAAPDVVWRVTEAIERWPEWTPTVTSVVRVGQGPLVPGSSATIKQPGQPKAQWVVTELEPGRRFVWETKRRGMQIVATHEISPEGAGTRNALRVEARGLVTVLLGPILRLALRRALSVENAGLKRYSEQASWGPAESVQ